MAIASNKCASVLSPPSASAGDMPNFNALAEEAQSSLTRLAPKAPVDFRFRWQGLGFVAGVREVEDGARLRLLGDLGPIPFSAEAPGERRTLLELISWSNADGKCRFIVDPRQRLTLLGEAPVPTPLTGAGIVASAVQFLLQAQPYIVLASEQRAKAANG